MNWQADPETSAIQSDTPALNDLVSIVHDENLNYWSGSRDDSRWSARGLPSLSHPPPVNHLLHIVPSHYRYPISLETSWTTVTAIWIYPLQSNKRVV
jgi:hypothetical protein